MVNEWMYGAASQSGWWMGPYSTGGDSHEGILRNTGALKNGISMLGEARGAGGATRPAEGGTQLAGQPQPQGLRAPVGELGGPCGTSTPACRRSGPRSRSRSRSRPATSPARTVLRGSYPWPLGPERRREPERPARRRHAAGRAGSSTRRRAATSSRRPSTRPDGPTATFGSVAQRLAIHGIKVEPQAGGVFVPLQQPLRRPGRADPRLRGGAADDRDGRSAATACPKIDLPVGGTVPATLSLTLGAPATFGAFTPGVAQGLHGDAPPPT